MITSEDVVDIAQSLPFLCGSCNRKNHASICVSLHLENSEGFLGFKSKRKNNQIVNNHKGNKSHSSNNKDAADYLLLGHATDHYTILSLLVK